jgi:hypothetical protein
MSKLNREEVLFMCRGNIESRSLLDMSDANEGLPERVVLVELTARRGDTIEPSLMRDALGF